MKPGDINLSVDNLDISLRITLPSGDQHSFVVKEELMIDASDLDAGMADQPGKYAFWGMLAEAAKLEEEREKANLDVEEAEADYRIREEFKLDGTKITESLVSKSIPKDDGYRAVQERYFLAKKNARTLQHVLKAFDHRKDSLVGLGANNRTEFGNLELSIKKAEVRKKLEENE